MLKKLTRIVITGLAAAALLGLDVRFAHAACSQTVTNTNDSGSGSLRAAVSAVTSGGTVCFSIGSGQQTITLSSELGVNKPMTIDGTTQPGWSSNPIIEITFTSTAAGGSGIDVTGGNTTIRGLDVNSAPGDEIILNNNGGNTVKGNWVGIDLSGTTAKRNKASGIGISTNNNVVGGTTPADRNVAAGNGGTGIAITNGSNNIVSGNYVGTNPSGTIAIPNGGDGILLNDASNNTIGGTTGVTVGGDCTGACNLSSGNTSNGIGIEGATASGNTVEGNYVGTDIHGTGPLPNGDDGFESQSPNNTIGGTTPVARNIFSGNPGAGVALTTTNATGNTVEGNFIGTDVSGVVAMGNHKMGVNIGSPDGSSNNASANTIGGDTGTTPGGNCTGPCNVIAANSWSGIFISGSTGGGNNIIGNFIGMGVNGGITLGNAQDGVGIVDSPNNHFGGPSAGARNLISGNGGNGVAIRAADATGTRIEGNYIGEGTDAGCMPNHHDGVVDETAPDTAIIGNNIWCSGYLGIDLGNNGVGAANGANENQNWPVLGYAYPSGSNEAVVGSLNSAANTSYRIDLFGSQTCDSSGHGQGQIFLGSGNVTTDGAGNVSFKLSGSQVGHGTSVTATATKIINNTPWETSEFSNCVITEYQHPDGAIINPVGSPNQFEVVDGQVSYIGSPQVSRSWGITAGEVKFATTADTNMTGTTPLYFREGTLLKGSGPNVYVVDQTGVNSYTKRLITSDTAFHGLGYSANDILQVPDSVLPSTDGAGISDASQHPDGTLVKDPNGPNEYWLEGGMKQLVGSPLINISQRFTSAQVKTATAADLSLATDPNNLYFREGTLLKGSGPNIYVVDQTGVNSYTKRLISSPLAFNDLQYHTSEILNVPDSVLPASNGPNI